MPVTLPEELPVHETLDLAEGLGEDRRTLGAVIVNQVAASQFPARGWPQVQAELSRTPESQPWRGMAERALEGLASQAEVLDHLRSSMAAISGLELPILELPRLDPREPRRLVETLAERLKVVA